MNPLDVPAKFGDNYGATEVAHVFKEEAEVTIKCHGSVSRGPRAAQPDR
jgi:hypothetical protein